jgi:PAS domain S-box-containing protein
MDVQPGDVAEEIKRLQRCINDLVGLFALPAMWSGGEPSQIVQTLLDALLRMLQLDVVYARLKDSDGRTPIEMLRFAKSQEQTAQEQAGQEQTQPHEIGEVFKHWLGAGPRKWPPAIRIPLGGRDISILPLGLGLQGEIGEIVAGSEREDFPRQTERLILSVAANQASIGLQGARILSEQKHVASELDRRVAQRTEELAKANEELQLQVGLLQHIPVAAWTLRPDGTPDFVNQNWLEYTGQTFDYIRSHPEAWMAAIHPEDREMASSSFWGGVRAGQGFTFEARFRRVYDEAYRWHLNRAVVLRDAAGEILRFVGTSTDIDDLKQSQDDLRRADERTRLIVETALDAVVTMNSQGLITSWNKQAETIFGWSSAEAIGRDMADMIIPEQHRTAHRVGLHRFLATGEGPILRRRIEIMALRRSGAEFQVELEVVPVKLRQDWVFSAFIRDITESRRAEEKLRASELHLRRMTETIPEMLWSATAEGAIDYCNTRVLDYAGFPAEDLMGDGWIELLHTEDADRAARLWRSCVASGAPYRVEVRTFRLAGRMYRWCVMSALPLLDQEGRIVKWYGTIVDMHDWKQAQEDLRNSQAELAHMARVMTMGELTASIAHEVNQPLAAIVASGDSCAAWLSNDPPNLDKARAAASRIIQAATQASEIVQRLRALFKKTASMTAPVDMNGVIEDTISLVHHEAERNKIFLRAELDPGVPSVSGDRVQLQQVILNLAMNGIESIAGLDHEPKRLMIRSTLSNTGELLVSVEDTGLGIEAENADRLFAPFFTTKAQGIGMGLPICRSIIEAHGGRLWADKNEPRGAVFHFALPVTAPIE